MFTLKTPVATKTVQQELHQSNIDGRPAIAKLLITENGAERREDGVMNMKMSDDWKYIIWSDEPSFTLFPPSVWVYVWRMPREAYNPEWLFPTVKHRGGCVVIWAGIAWYSDGPIITVNGEITASEYVDILGNQVYQMVEIFPNINAVFQDDSLPIHTTRSFQFWFEVHEDALQHLPWPAELPYLNIIKPLWSVVESTVRSRFPPSSSVMQPEDVLHEEWYNNPLETIQNLHESIPRRIQAVLQANGGLTPY